MCICHDHSFGVAMPISSKFTDLMWDRGTVPSRYRGTVPSRSSSGASSAAACQDITDGPAVVDLEEKMAYLHLK